MSRNHIRSGRPHTVGRLVIYKLQSSGMFEIWHYLTASGRNVVEDWLESLHDRKAEARIAARLARLVAGNFGDCKPVGSGVWELRVDWGPGYRVYYALTGPNRRAPVVRRGQRTQTAHIQRAIEYWKDYKRRTAAP